MYSPGLVQATLSGVQRFKDENRDDGSTEGSFEWSSQVLEIQECFDNDPYRHPGVFR